MSERTKRRMRMATGAVTVGLSRHQPWCLLGMLVLGVCCLCVSVFSAGEKKARVYPPQEVVMDAYPNYLLGRIEEALSFSSDWPAKSRFIEGLKKWHERNEILEYKFGPLEIPENETIDKATRVAVPILSMKIRNRSTGQVATEVGWKDGVRNIVEVVLDKRETPEGPRWSIVAGGPAARDLESTGWLNAPRKKVADSPTIILKKAVVAQAILEGKVVSEKVISADQ